MAEHSAAADFIEFVSKSHRRRILNAVLVPDPLLVATEGGFQDGITLGTAGKLLRIGLPFTLHLPFGDKTSLHSIGQLLFKQTIHDLSAVLQPFFISLRHRIVDVDNDLDRHDGDTRDGNLRFRGSHRGKPFLFRATCRNHATTHSQPNSNF